MSNFRTSLLASAMAVALLSAPAAFAQSAHAQHQAGAQDKAGTAAADQDHSRHSSAHSNATGMNAGTDGRSQADASARAGAQKSWAELDADRDGNVSQTEAAADPALVAAFTEIDRDADGSVTAVEYRVYEERPQGAGSAAMASGAGTQKSWADLDANRDGNISQGEAAAEPALVAVFAEIDGNADGSLTTDEYRGYAERAQGAGGADMATADAGKMSWTEIDTDKSGSISKTEAVVMPALVRVFADADADADGLLTADEYRSYAERASAEGTTGTEADADAGANVDADVDAGMNADAGRDDGTE